MGLCSVCSKIPFSTLFGPSRRRRQYSIGTLNVARSNSADCSFCHFLLESYALAYDSAQRRELELKGEVRFGFQILPRPNVRASEEEEPWFERAGITIEAQAGPALWLRFKGIQRNHLEVNGPLICVSLVPASTSPDLPSGIIPRRRSCDEVTSSTINYAEIQQWLQVCKDTHSGLCNHLSTAYKRRSLTKLRLINIHDRRIRFATEDTPYVALSYVWGDSHRTAFDYLWNATDPDEDNIPLPMVLPSTITDALTFTQAMGYHFLWIDVLCIHQRSSEDKSSQIASMHLIYECATFTIAAVDSENADTGLYGVSRPFEKTYQPRIKTAFGEFMATYVFDVWSNQGLLAWERRAWTLQELLLSRRVVFLHRNYALMRCQSEFFVSLIEVNNRPGRPVLLQSDKYYWENGFDVRLNDSEWSFLQFDNILANYTRRQLSIQDDVLKACEGTLSLMTTNTGMSFEQGMPIADLHLALLWKPHHLTSLIPRRNFPSWSWTGWIGRVEHHYCVDELAGYEEEGMIQRRKELRRRRRHLSFDQQTVLGAEEAFINYRNGPVLKIASHIAQASLRKVKSAGQKIHGLPRDSEQADEAVGDHWVLIKDDQDLRNDIGEVARFEAIPYSFQVHPSISEQIEKSKRSCILVYIKYFPFLRDRQRTETYSWCFDYVACLVVLKNLKAEPVDRYQRIGFVFVRLVDWISFKLELKAVHIV